MVISVQRESGFSLRNCSPFFLMQTLCAGRVSWVRFSLAFAGWKIPEVSSLLVLIIWTPRSYHTKAERQRADFMIVSCSAFLPLNDSSSPCEACSKDDQQDQVS